MPRRPCSTATAVAPAASSRWVHDDAAAITDDRHLALPDQLDKRLRRTRAIEVAVAQHDALERSGEHGLLEEADRGQGLRLRLRRPRVERIVLALDRPTLTDVRPARVALSDEALDPGRVRGGEQVLAALRPQL